MLISSTDLLIIRILLIALLGLLMSFTPCIYPMIPITIGIMQGQANKSILTSFLHALSYSVGIATTFALLGLLAALSGTIFGMLLTNPFVVLLIVAMLVYLALSMFGLYEIKIPSFLQERNRKHSSSFLSSFAFGALSGTVASPCLSPGLALVLCIVASLGNAFLGFLLLFSFGIGLSIPLLIIGTFSSSLNLLPRAGTWMVEVKKIFGFLLLGMSFYYLKNILPFNLLLWLVAIFCAISGIYYLLSGSDREARFIKRFKIIVGILFLTSAIHLGFQAYGLHYQDEYASDSFWITNYQEACQKASEERKNLFLDFWAPSCSICTAIDKTLLKDKDVRAALENFVPTKLELVMTDETIMELKNKFNIIGLPTFIVFNPRKNKVVKKWGGELYNTKKEAFIEELRKVA
jgi:thiol:disulfide interchange protein DsbD